MSTIEQLPSLSQYRCQLLNSSSVSLSTNVNFWTVPQSLLVQMSTIEQFLSLSTDVNSRSTQQGIGSRLQVWFILSESDKSGVPPLSPSPSEWITHDKK